MQPMRVLSVRAAAVLVLLASATAAQIQRPSGFLDISGTYLYRQFDAYCKQVHPLNDVLRLARVGDVEETSTGAVLRKCSPDTVSRLFDVAARAGAWKSSVTGGGGAA
jgi:hypothetical protein